MLRSRRLHPVEAALFIAALLIFAGTIYVATRPGTGSSSSERVALSIFPNAWGDYVYNSTFLRAHVGSVVEFTITNFDPQSHPTVGPYDNVSGTRNGMMWWTGGMMGGGNRGGQELNGLTPDEISHTFTIQMGGYELNVPIPPAANGSGPSVITFTVQMFGASDLTWQCDANDMGPTTGPDGGMMGILAVS